MTNGISIWFDEYKRTRNHDMSAWISSKSWWTDPIIREILEAERQAKLLGKEVKREEKDPRFAFYAFDFTNDRHMERFSQIRKYDSDLLNNWIELALEEDVRGFRQLEYIAYNYPMKKVKFLRWCFG